LYQIYPCIATSLEYLFHNNLDNGTFELVHYH
jgi:hypothetical protein